MADLIKSIREHYGFDIDVVDAKARQAICNLTENMEQAVRSLSEDLYSKDTHFILEFVQNADDNAYLDDVEPRIIFDLHKDRMIISCNENGFSAEDIRAVCSVGRSTKKNKIGYIGEKGIGFKSVFKVANAVYISSKEYTFKFDKEQQLGMIIPIWQTDYPVKSGWTTFHLHLSPSANLDVLSSRLNDIQPSLLLFLRRIRHIQVKVNGIAHRYRRSDDLSNSITSIEYDGTASQYLVVKYTAKIDIQEPKREGIEESEIVLAFPVESQGKPMVQDQAIHAFMPIRIYPIPFIVQGDFLLASNREDILVDSKWNAALRAAIAFAFRKAVQDHFRKHAGLIYDWLRYIPTATSDVFVGNLRQSITRDLAAHDCLLCVDEVYRKPSEVIVLGPEFRDAEGAPLIPIQYIPGKHYISPHYDVCRDDKTLRQLGATYMDVFALVAGLKGMHGDGAITQKDLKWTDTICGILLTRLRQLSGKTRRKFSNLLKQFPLVPLVDGKRVGAEQSKLLFDRKLVGIPKDLGIHLVQDLPRTSSHYSLLTALGIQEAEPSYIAGCIAELHRTSIGHTHLSDLPSHAFYLFSHDSSTSPPQLYVLTRDGASALSTEVYLDHEAGSAMKTFITLGKAKVLHEDYHKQGTPSSRNKFMRFLPNNLGINTSPRVIDGDLSPELRTFVQRADTTAFLAVMKTLWSSMKDKLGREGLKRLRAVVVTCSGGARRRIDTTFVKRDELEQLQGTPFLPLDDPSNPSWDFLANLGVSLTLDASCYLQQLRQIAQAGGQPMIESLQNLYHRLETRFDDGKGAMIREAFRTECLIYVPPGVAYVGPFERDRWISSVHAVRGGPLSMQTRLNISHAYPTLEHFFHGRLGVVECPSNILVEEWKTTLGQGGSIPPTRVSSLLSDVCDVISNGGRSDNLSNWLAELSALAIFPVRTSTGNLVQKCITDDFFIPDDSGELSKLFADSCDVLHTPAELPFHRLKPLLESTGFITHVMKLENAVKVETTTTGTVLYLEQESNEFSSRLRYIERLLKASASSGNRLPARGRVQRVDTIRSIYTLNGIERIKSRPLTVKINEDCNLFDVHVSESCQKDTYPLYLAEGVSKALPQLTMGDLLIVFSSPPSIVDKYMERKGIQDLPPSHMDSPAGTQEEKLTAIRELAQGATLKDAERSSHQQGPAMSVKSQARPSLDRSAAVNVMVEDNLDTILQMTFDQPSESDQLSVIAPASSLNGDRNGIPIPAVTDFDMQERDSTHRTSRRRSRPATAPRSDRPQKKRRITLAEDTSGSCEDGGQSIDVLNLPSLNNVLHGQQEDDPTVREAATGILGEFFMFKVFKDKLRLPQFDEKNWTSKLRVLVPGFEEYTDEALADFTYQDSEGVLTKEIFGNSQYESWKGRWPTYHIEVKSTTNTLTTPFHLSKAQLKTASAMSHRDTDLVPGDMYILARVWSVLSGDNITFKLYADPHRLLYDGSLEITSGVEMVADV